MARNMLAGWAVCCSGDKAFAVRAYGNHTYDRSEVTCKACLKVLAKHDAYAAEMAREPLPPGILADACQDVVHKDTGPTRAARAVRTADNGSAGQS